MRTRAENMTQYAKAYRCYRRIFELSPYSWTVYPSSTKVLGSQRSIIDTGKCKKPKRPVRVLLPKPCTRERYYGEYDSDYSLQSEPPYYSEGNHLIATSPTQGTSVMWVAELRGNPCARAVDNNLSLLPEERYNPVEAVDAFNKMYATITSPPNIQGMTWLLELQETVSMLKNPLKSIINCAALFGKKHRRPRKPGKRPRRKAKRVPRPGSVPASQVSSAYLEWSYGWLPLAKQIDDACHEFAEAWSQRPMKVRRYSGKSTVCEESSTLVVSKTFGEFTCKFLVTETLERSYVAIGYGNDTMFMVPRYGTSMSDTLVAIWEIIPYSHVVDWFLGVQTWLNRIRVIPGFKLYSHCITIRVRKQRTVELCAVLFTYNGKTTPCAFQPAKLTQERVYTDRSVNSNNTLGFPAGPLVWKLAKTFQTAAMTWQRLPQWFKSKPFPLKRRK